MASTSQAPNDGARRSWKAVSVPKGRESRTIARPHPCYLAGDRLATVPAPRLGCLPQQRPAEIRAAWSAAQPGGMTSGARDHRNGGHEHDLVLLAAAIVTNPSCRPA